jgi:hypothetical protein
MPHPAQQIVFQEYILEFGVSSVTLLASKVARKNTKITKNILTSLEICGSRAFSAEKKVKYSQFFG